MIEQSVFQRRTLKAPIEGDLKVTFIRLLYNTCCSDFLDRGSRQFYTTCLYDTVSDVVESGVHWRSNFQIGSGVLKNCYRPNLMHIYGTQCDFMHRSCWNHSNFENSWFYHVIWTSDPQNHCLLGPRNRVAVNFFNRYVIYWVVPCERARPELSEYVWQRGVESLQGRVTAAQSWPLFQEKKMPWAVSEKAGRPQFWL